jgi:YHS domain-containing protein
MNINSSQKALQNLPVPKRLLISALALVMVVSFTYMALGLVIKGSTAPVTAAPQGSGGDPGSAGQEQGYTINRDAPDGYRQCPVCSVMMQESAVEFTHRLKKTGEVFYFDREKCYQEFLEDPDRYTRVKYNVDLKITGSPSPRPTSDSPSGDPSSSPRVEDIVIDSQPPGQDAPPPESNTYAPPAEAPPAADMGPPPEAVEAPVAPSAPIPAQVPSMPKYPMPSLPPNPMPVITPPSGNNLFAPPPAQPVPDPAAPAQPDGQPGKNTVQDLDIPDGAIPPPRDGQKLKTTPIPPPPGGESHSY